MSKKHRPWRRVAARVFWSLGTFVLLPTLAQAGSELLPAFTVPVSQPEMPVVEPAEPQAKAAPAEVRVLSLAECVQIALEKQPALAAYRASLAAAQAQEQALQDLKLAGIISHDLPIRRKQAALGVTVAAAGLKQAEWDTIYAVTRNYFTVLFGQAQQKVAQEAVDNLRATRDTAKSIMEAPEGDKKNRDQKERGRRIEVRQSDVDRIDTYQLLAEARKLDADRGVDRALAALREAMGVDCDFPCFLPKGTLPLPQVEIDCCQVVDFALARRGELIQAINVAEVTALEIEAQAATCLPVSRTFASVVDVHVRPIPQEVHDGEYRPGAVGVEMPPNLVGKKHDRVARATDFDARAHAVVDKTRGLIILESKDVFLRWQQASGKIPKARDARSKANTLFTDAQKDLAEGTIAVKDQLDTIVLKVQAQVTYNEEVYRQLLALADLQRVTGGGLLLGWDGCVKEPSEVLPEPKSFR